MADQKTAPYVAALKKYLDEGVTPFDVPGHHMGNVDNNVLKELLGKKVYEADVNAPIGLDNLSNPSGVIKEAQALMAEACQAQEAFFLVNGTTSGILAMIMATCRPNEKIILPRNAHKSITSALILSGATPIYVMPRIDNQLEIANQPSIDDYKKAILKYPSAKAILVINPTYFGAVINLEELVIFAHEHNTAVLVDEAHGAHYYFSDIGPKNAMQCGADMSSVSFHKTGGSLTQSSILLFNSKMVEAIEVRKALNILNTTSPSTILLASLDAARLYMEEYGREAMKGTYELAHYAETEIAKIPGFVPQTPQYFKGRGCFDKDITKLVIEIDRIPLSGPEVMAILKKEYHVQMELGETYVLLAIIAIGTLKKHIDQLIRGLKGISKQYFKAKLQYPTHQFDIAFPYMLVRPRSAYQAPSKKIHLLQASGEVAKESIMIYPPGIPIIVPGEVFNDDIIKRIESYRNTKGVTVLSDYNDGNVSVIDAARWKRYEVYHRKIVEYAKKRMTTPRNDGYFLRNEAFSREQFFVYYPGNMTKNKRLNESIKKEFIRFVNLVSEHQHVTLGAKKSDFKDLVNLDYPDNVEIIPLRLDSIKTISEIPLIVENEEHHLRFLSYYPSYSFNLERVKSETKIMKSLYNFGKYDTYTTDNYLPYKDMILLDGDKVCLVLDEPLTLEDSIIRLSHREIEENVKVYFNVERVIWIDEMPTSLKEMGINLSDIVRFAGPMAAVVAQTKDHQLVANYAEKIAKKLKKEGINIIRVPLFLSLLPNKMEIGALGLEENKPVVQSYVGFGKGHDFLILPAFNVNSDKEVIKKLQSQLPHYKIYSFDSYYFNLLKTNLFEVGAKIPFIE